MGILIDPTPSAKRYSGMVKPAIEAVVNVLSGSYVDAAFKAYDAIKAERSDDETPAQRAWTLWRESLARTLEIFFDNAYLTRKPADREEFGRVMAGILAESEQIVRDDKVGLSALHLLKPSDFPAYRALRAGLPDLARLVAPDHLRDDPELQRRLDRAFAAGFFQARVGGAEHFKPLTEALAGAEGLAMHRWDEWRRYYEHLRWTVEDDLLFGQGDGGPSLDDIFVPLRCYWRERPAPAMLDDEKADRTVTAHVSWLRESLLDWLDNDDRNDLLRIVTGGPGCGKSSSAKILALEVARRDRHDVYLVSLQGLDVTRSIQDIVAEHVRRVQPGGKSLSDSPIDWQPFSDKPLFLIFDGLDEVARPDGAGPDVTRKFVSNLRNWLQDSHREASEVRIKALALGRLQAAEAAADEITLEDCALLHVAPLSELDEERCGRSHDAVLELSDPDSLAPIDQRATFWEKWSAAKPCVDKEQPKALSEPALADLTVEPLLLYLLIYSGYASEQWEEAAENRNRIYQAIFEEVHKREIKKRRDESEGLIKDPKDFRTLMECLGLAAWQGGGRTGDTEQFKILRDKIYAPERREAFRAITNADLDNVALQFYTHSSRGEHAGYAFIHKSFGEYLTARALIEAGDQWLSRHEGDAGDFAADWLQLTGGARLTGDILRFMIDEARLRAQDRPNDARATIKALTEIVRHILDAGFPAHQELIVQKGKFDWRRREFTQTRSEWALYALVNSWHEATQPISDGRTLFGFSNLTQSNMSLGEFVGADFVNAKLVGANCRESNFSGANFIAANLTAVDLRLADLSGATFIGANLDYADLKGAKGLVKEQVDLAKGNIWTVLPDEFERPDHWANRNF